MDNKDGLDRDAAERLFLQELDTIERAIAFVCRRSRLQDDEAEEFASWVRVKLIDRDFATIRKHDRSANFAAFISVVVHHLLLDYRVIQWGKWHASAQARRLGDQGVAIEVMLRRDGRTIDESLPALRRRWPELTRERVEEIASMLPARTMRPRHVELEAAADEPGCDAGSVADSAFTAERAELCRRIGRVVRAVIREMNERDRVILRLHFEGGMPVAQISRMLEIEQKPLYRRIKRYLLALRGRLEKEGISSEEANEVLGSRHSDLDFGFREETAEARLSLRESGRSSDEEEQ